jgi:hypothetical protein
MVAPVKPASIIIAIAAFIAGIRAAQIWNDASRVEIIPLWIRDGRIEPVMPGQAQAEWTNAIIEAANKSSDLNRRAARWTAAAVALGTVSTLIGAL